jgi:hypothetical protein
MEESSSYVNGQFVVPAGGQVEVPTVRGVGLGHGVLSEALLC